MSEIPVPIELPPKLRDELIRLHDLRGLRSAPVALFYAAYAAGYREGAKSLAGVLHTNIDAGDTATEVMRNIEEICPR